ncbi:RNA-directed DNA polymerase, eukaryota [Tanacetum coccineum]
MALLLFVYITHGFLEDDFHSVIEDSWNNDDSLIEIDLRLDKGICYPDDLTKRANLFRDLKDIDHKDSTDLAQKAKIKWAVEGDENSNFFHDIVNKKRRQVAIKGILVEGEWIENPNRVISEFYSYYSNLLSALALDRFLLDDNFPRRLDTDQAYDLEDMVSNEEIRKRVFFKWDCALKVRQGQMECTFGLSVLIGCQYKIIGKILANRLCLVIGDIVSQEQSAFIKGRQIMDGPLILNEVISWCKARKEQLLMFKVDFQKAFDSVRWDHLDDILGKFGFGNKWRGGLRQGDPLSPFLFILVMESLHVSFQRLIDRGVKVNVHKSSIYGVGVRSADVQHMAENFGCISNNLPFTYLGVKVGANMMRLNSWSDVVKKVSNKLSNWKAKTLSVGGRLTLLKSVLGAIPLFKAPEVLAHKNKGGLGVNSLFALNLASIFKWIWRFLASSSSLWIKVIKSIHGNSCALDNPYLSRLGNSTWIGILKAINKLKVKGVDLMGFCKIVIGNGSTTRFWHDIWYGDICFKEKFKRLFNLELQKDANVASKLQASNVASSFRQPPRSGIENSQFIELEQILSSISLSSIHTSFSMSVELARLIGRWWNIHIPIFDDPSSWDSWFNDLLSHYKLAGINLFRFKSFIILTIHITSEVADAIDLYSES